jgi:hypothetical protein
MSLKHNLPFFFRVNGADFALLASRADDLVRQFHASEHHSHVDPDTWRKRYRPRLIKPNQVSRLAILENELPPCHFLGTTVSETVLQNTEERLPTIDELQIERSYPVICVAKDDRRGEEDLGGKRSIDLGKQLVLLNYERPVRSQSN